MALDIRDDGVESKSRLSYFCGCNFLVFLIVLVVTDNLFKVQLDQEPDMREIVPPNQ